jgi:signal-transduction protein with cAMP-binding, CBS, and nucleotidyltransferase domain
MEVRRVMTRELVVVSPQTPRAELAKRMAEKKVRHLLVCRDERLIGLVSDRDLHMRNGNTAQCCMQLLERILKQVQPPAEPELAATPVV